MTIISFGMTGLDYKPFTPRKASSIKKANANIVAMAIDQLDKLYQVYEDGSILPRTKLEVFVDDGKPKFIGCGIHPKSVNDLKALAKSEKLILSITTAKVLGTQLYNRSI